MSAIIQKALILGLWLSLAMATSCPSGELNIEDFPSLVGDNFVDVSKFYDAMYEVKVGE